jgi:superfamily II DNA or RNA helicase
MLKSGIYEQIINKELSSQLEEYQGNLEKLIKVESIDFEEASNVLAKYLAEVIQKGLSNIKDNGKDINSQVELCNRLIDTVVSETGEQALGELSVDKRAEMLLALIDKQNSIHAIDTRVDVIRPITSIAHSSLFTGAVHEPSMFTELKREILSCNRIDMLISFIKWSGLRLIIDELRQFTQHGKLRIITTSYMGATDVKAIEVLRELPNTEIKISYDTKRTRLHAKTYVFYRNTGFTTAYIGSSNPSNAAISSGLEWNVKATAKDLPDTIAKIDATFESYWNSKDFTTYTEGEKIRLEKAIRAERNFAIDKVTFQFDINPYTYQSEILDKLEAERKVRGYYRNLIVAATGTGKTVISAFDYKRFCYENKGKLCRLLFIAHREEILKQSIDCFRIVLKDTNFGELFVGNYTPESIDYLFMSIQTFNACKFDKSTTYDFYDYIIVDEFHHAAAPTYQRLLEYYKPDILLGLTATPERMDGENILKYFDNRIAAEIRLPEAIDRKLLCPFQYFGIADNISLSDLMWVRGGYQKRELSNLYTGNDMRCIMIRQALEKYCTDIDEVKGLGFCVSVEHAEYMSFKFNQLGIPSIHLTSESNEEVRNTAKQRLVRGEIRFIFVVDLYNEGVDIPEINTILFLRPTESLTVFLQQLGRGLRLAEGKECLTVLDFIGQANKRYNFENKFSTLLENTSRGVQREVKDGFVSLPKGCFIQLEKIAKEYILDNIRSAFGGRAGIITGIASFVEDTQKQLTISNFIEHHHIDIKSIYSKDSFSRLCVLAGAKDDFDEPDEELITKAFVRFCAIDSRRWIEFMLDILPNIEKLIWSTLSDIEQRMLMMTYFTIYQKSAHELGYNSVIDGLVQIKRNLVMYEELLELLKVCYNRIDFVDEIVDLGFECPLDLHCTYTRDQLLSAVDYYTLDRTPAMREGVKYLPDKNLDIFLITLNKSDKDYSETTMYKDYSINEYLFHWQSQSTTPDTSPTGQRYINHRKLGTKILFFVREYNKDIAGTSPYTFLGLADYVEHHGSRPMNIVWKLKRPIPAKYLKKTNKLVVG